jgi:Zn-finger nucleic acid-binding protein
MKCPRCDTLLNEITKAGVLVDACPRCLGMWLDRGELEKIGARLREVEREWSEPVPAARRDEPPRAWRRDDDDDDRRRPWGDDDDDYRHRRKRKWSDIFEIFD